MITVKEHTRRPQDKPEDPFAPVIDARRRAYAKRWGVELVGTDDACLSRPVAEPVRGGPSLASIAEQLRGLAKLMSNIGR
jgi:hypothetical protein